MTGRTSGMTRTRRTGRLAAWAAAVCLAAVAPAHGQTSGAAADERPPKESFVKGFTDFVAAIRGTFGDEGVQVTASLDVMRRALTRWDAFVLEYTAAVVAQSGGAPPARAAELRRALGIVYLDRGRVEDALREFAAAAELDPTRADVPYFLGVISSRMGRAEQAAPALRDSSRLDPSRPVTFYLLARELARAGQTEGAAQARGAFVSARRTSLGAPAPERPPAPFLQWGLVREPVAAMPVFPPARYAEGFTLLRQGRYGEALDVLGDAAAEDPLVATSRQAVGERLSQASAALRQRRLSDARDQARAAADLAPKLAEARRLLGTIHWAGGQRAESITELEAAIRLNPEDERARMALADVLVAEGRFEGAEEVLLGAIEAIPGSGEAHFKLGQVRTTLKKHEEALHAFEGALERRPLVGAGYLHGVMGELNYAVVQDLDAAIAHYSQRVEEDVNNPNAHVELGTTYLDVNRDEEAVAEFLAALMIDPQHINAHAALGQALLRMGEYADAERAARRAVEHDPMHAGARYTLATALLRLGRTTEGREEFETYQRMLSEARVNRRRDFQVGVLMRQVRDSRTREAHEETATLLEEAIELKPDDPALHANLGVALMNGGRLEEAVGAFERALQLGAGLEVHRYLAEILTALGRPDEAQRHRTLAEQPRAEGR